LSSEEAPGPGTQAQEVKSINWVDKQCATPEWFTPESILECVRAYYAGPIPLDPATHPSNPTKALRFYTQADDGLKQPWTDPVFINPPYGKEIRLWCEAIHNWSLTNVPIVALLPCGARFSTKYWQQHILSERLQAVCFVRSRVKFLREDGSVGGQNPYDSAIYLYNGTPTKFQEAFGKLGKCFSLQLLTSG
jgi:site-specific DNA-methyltransferase (adenine-specific)